MYEYINGQVSELSTTYVVIDCSGVGYYINISLQTYSEIEKLTTVKLYVHYVVREDAQLFYGFASKAERELFRLLIGVSGVGGNTARMILSTYSPNELRSIISTENAVLLKNVKGLGLKTAQKIIVDLNGKMTGIGASEADMRIVIGNEVYDQTLAALMALGFAKTAADKVVRSVVKENPDASIEEAVRLSLKGL